ncbi:hypothetical protein ACQ4PT_002090 [Festuca glaucescens]
MSGGRDLFAALPDELLKHVLAYLPSRKAVKLSRLSRRWRHLWRSTPAVCVRGKGEGVLLFVNTLLINREASPLRSFDIDVDLVVPPVLPGSPYNDPEFYHSEYLRGEVDPHVDMWVRHALSSKCRAPSLMVRLEDKLAPWLPRSPLTFASPNLTTLHLDAVHLVDGLLDFSYCPALLRLVLVRCYLEGDTLASPSLAHLAVVDCHTESGADLEAPDEEMFIEISTPKLRFLEISENYYRRQLLQMMPWLTEENVQYVDEVDMSIRRRFWVQGIYDEI